MRMRIVGVGLAMGLLGFVSTSPAAAISTAPASPTGYWKLYVSMDYESRGTVTETECYPEASQAEPTTMTATARETIRVRTARPTLIETHVAPNGIAIVQKWLFSPAFKAQITSTRESGLEGNGPRGCFDNSNLTYKPHYDCGTRKERTGLYISPVGEINRWRGFDVQPQEFPSFQTCSLTDAQGKLPYPFEVVLEDKPARLLSRKVPKIVYRGKWSFKRNYPAQEGEPASSATGTFSYEVTLVKGYPNYR